MTPDEQQQDRTGGDDGADLRVQLFNAATELMKNEAQLVWGRYNAMLTANSLVALILGAILTKSDRRPVDLATIVLSSLFGIVLSTFWYKLTKNGWELSHRWADEARGYSWPGQRNPIEVYYRWRDSAQSRPSGPDRIQFYAKAVIVLFIVGYVAVGLVAVCALICRHWCRVA